MRTDKKKAFTLIEILVTLAIILILAGALVGAGKYLRVRAEHWSSALGLGTLIETRSTVGGGSLPEETLPTWALALDLPKPQTVLARLRQSQPPIIARVEEQRVLLDPRTVLPEQDETLLRLLREALAALPAASIRGKAS